MVSSNLHEKLLATQDRDADIDLLRGALSIDSVTGNETGFATFPYTLGNFDKAGFRTKTGKIELYSERLAALGLDPLPAY
nr:hypothetical protein [Pseudomonadota bacterium]